MIKLSLAALAAVVIVATPALAQQVKGKVTSVEGEGRTVVIDDKKVAVSGSGTKVMIKNASGTRADITAGMTCTADAEKATTITCE
jgi:hypothetical protein